MATHSSILAWRIPWTEEPGGLQSTGSQRVDMTEQLHFHFTFKHVINVTNSYFYQSKSRRLSTCIRWQEKWHSKVKEYLQKPAEREYDTVKPFFFILFFEIFMGIQLIYNVLLVLGIQQSESVIHISTLLQVIFPYRLCHSDEQSCLCYTVGPYQLSVLYIVVCICQKQSF